MEAFLPDHEIYITDWQDARHVSVSAGRFDLDDYIDTIASIFRFFEGDVHVFAVCQPSRINPTAVNALAENKGTAWFERNVITTVPWPLAGHGRAVYPGFLQLSGFMIMNLDRHMSAQREMFRHLVRGHGDSAAKHRNFYDEYMAVMDLTAEFYLQTIDSVFVRHLLPRGLMTSRDRPVDLCAHRVIATGYSD